MMQFSNYGCLPEGGGGVESLSPVTANLWAWHNAADTGSLVLVNGNEVSQWSDISGNGRHLTGISGSYARHATRSLNGLPVVDCNAGATEALYWDGSFGTIAEASDNTVFIVACSDTAGAPGTLLHARDNDSNKASWGLMLFTNLQDGAGYAMRGYHHLSNGSGGANQSNASGAPDTQPHIYGLRREGAQQKVILDNGYGNLAPAVDATPTGAMWLGARYFDGQLITCFDGIVAEVLLYDRALTQTEIDQNLAYLQDKWGLD